MHDTWVTGYARELMSMVGGNIAYPRLVAFYGDWSVKSGFYDQGVDEGAWHNDERIQFTITVRESPFQGWDTEPECIEEILTCVGSELRYEVIEARDQAARDAAMS